MRIKSNFRLKTVVVLKCLAVESNRYRQKYYKKAHSEYLLKKYEEYFHFSGYSDGQN